MTGARWRGSLSSGQLFWLLFVLMFPTMIWSPPGDLLRSGGRGAWLTPLAAAAPAAALCAWVGRAAGASGDWVTVARARLGPVAGRVALGLGSGALLLYIVAIRREFADIASMDYVLAEVPRSALLLLGMLLMPCIAWFGPVVMGRAASVLGPLMVVVFLLGVVVWVPSVKLVLVRPFLPSDIGFLNAGGLRLMVTWLVEPILGALVIQRASAPARARAGRTFASASLFAALLTSLTTWLIVGVAGVQHGSTLTTPFVTMLAAIEAGFFPLHLETVVMPIDEMAATVKEALFLWCAVRLARGVVPIPAPWLVAGVTLLATAAATLFATPVQTDAFIKDVVGVWALAALVGTCVLTYVAGARRAAA